MSVPDAGVAQCRGYALRYLDSVGCAGSPPVRGRGGRARSCGTDQGPTHADRRAFVWFESLVYDNFRYMPVMRPSEVSVYFVRLYFAFPALDSVRPVTAKQSAALAAERQASGSPPDAVKIDGHAAQLRLTG